MPSTSNRCKNLWYLFNHIKKNVLSRRLIHSRPLEPLEGVAASVGNSTHCVNHKNRTTMKMNTEQIKAAVRPKVAASRSTTRMGPHTRDETPETREEPEEDSHESPKSVNSGEEKTSSVSSKFLDILAKERRRSQERIEVIKRLRRLQEKHSAKKAPPRSGVKDNRPSGYFLAPPAHASIDPPKKHYSAAHRVTLQPKGQSPARAHCDNGLERLTRQNHAIETKKDAEATGFRAMCETPKRLLQPPPSNPYLCVSPPTCSLSAEWSPTSQSMQLRLPPSLSDNKLRPNPLAGPTEKTPPRSNRTSSRLLRLSQNDRILQLADSECVDSMGTTSSFPKPPTNSLQIPRLVDSTDSDIISVDLSEARKSAEIERQRADKFLADLAKTKADLLSLKSRLSASEKARRKSEAALLEVRKNQVTNNKIKSPSGSKPWKPFWRGHTAELKKSKRGASNEESSEESRLVAQLLKKIEGDMPVSQGRVSILVKLKKKNFGWEYQSAKIQKTN